MSDRTLRRLRGTLRSLSDLAAAVEEESQELRLVEQDLSETWRLRQIAVNLAALSRYVKQKATEYEDEGQLP